MPRTVYGAAARAAEAERKRQAAREQHIKDVARIIRTEAAALGIRSDKAIAEAAGMKPDTFGKTMSGVSGWTLDKLLAVCDALNMSCEARAAILGGGA